MSKLQLNAQMFIKSGIAVHVKFLFQSQTPNWSSLTVTHAEPLASAAYSATGLPDIVGVTADAFPRAVG